MSVFKKRGRKRNRGWNKGLKQSCVRKWFTPNTQNVIEKEAVSPQLANMASCLTWTLMNSLNYLQSRKTSILLSSFPLERSEPTCANASSFLLENWIQFINCAFTGISVFLTFYFFTFYYLYILCIFRDIYATVYWLHFTTVGSYLVLKLIHTSQYNLVTSSVEKAQLQPDHRHSTSEHLTQTPVVFLVPTNVLKHFNGKH